MAVSDGGHFNGAKRLLHSVVCNLVAKLHRFVERTMCAKGDTNDFINFTYCQYIKSGHPFGKEI